MKTLKLLILDDDEMNLNEYSEEINLFNLTNEEFKFEAFSCVNLSEGKNLLLSNSINYAIIDLRLHNSISGASESGNDLIIEIQESFRIPTTVVSGFLNDFDSEIKKSFFINCISRDKANISEILNNFCVFEKCGLSDIFGTSGKLDNLINSIFWNNIANIIDPNDKSTCITSDNILRYISNYIKEFLTYTTDGIDIDYHPIEFYFIPPIHNKILNGTILEYDGRTYVNLTPACDISNDKTKYFQLVSIDSFESCDEIKKCLETVSPDNKSKVEKNLKKILTNNSSLKYHFLPPHRSFKGGLINFQTVISINKKEIIESSQIIGSISPDFIKDITARFGLYYSRQGQPNFSNLEYIYKNLYENN
ncbi:response regulator [Clostridium tertium]|uniref:hypothetical protein n=1 Tax=Clostridium tertium TaxID=1559 RepID=UPI00291B6868|nr:hypothetical protein [Clostridium sp.]